MELLVVVSLTGDQYHGRIMLTILFFLVYLAMVITYVLFYLTTFSQVYLLCLYTVITQIEVTDKAIVARSLSPAVWLGAGEVITDEGVAKILRPDFQSSSAVITLCLDRWQVLDDLPILIGAGMPVPGPAGVGYTCFAEIAGLGYIAGG